MTNDRKTRRESLNNIVEARRVQGDQLRAKMRGIQDAIDMCQEVSFQAQRELLQMDNEDRA